MRKPVLRATHASAFLFVAAVALAGPAAVRAAAAAAAIDEAAEEIIRTSGVQGGLVVHLGCSDGRLTAALCRSESFLVHGLDADADNVQAARKHAESLGLAGRVSIEHFSAGQRGDGRGRLPFVDNLVRLLVAEELGGVSVEEVKRVLAPGGVALFKQGDNWTRAVKPWPEEIDEWTHFLYDASGNAVAHDALVGPPRHIQWTAAPTWSRNHHVLASISSVVTAGGRVFYIVDEGPPASMKVPGNWSLVARDAFSGVLLWKRPISSWAWTGQKFRSGPVQLPRTLVASGDRVYAPLGISAPVSLLDAASGELLQTYEATGAAEELIVDGGTLLVVSGSPASEQAAIDPAQKAAVPFPNDKSIVAVAAGSGELLWRWSETPDARLMPLTLAAADSRVFFQAGGDVVCLDRQIGKELWRRPVGEEAEATAGAGRRGKPDRDASRSLGWSVATLVVADGVVLAADARQLVALAADGGKRLWSCPSSAGFKSPVDVLVIDGLVWLGPEFTEGRDLHSGEIRKTNSVVEQLWTIGHHHRCYREKATDRYLLTGKRGIEFVDLVADNHSRNNWVRGTCQYGVMPANGLVYAPAHACGCFMEAKLYGFWALATERDEGPGSRDEEQEARLERGPAYGWGQGSGFGVQGSRIPSNGPRLSTLDSQLSTPTGWPTYRGNPMRSGSTEEKIAMPLATVWQSDVGGRLSPPVAAEGLVVVSSIDEHRVVALGAGDGKPRWSFTAGGRVDSPPTLYQGLVLFGSTDGCVYALRAADGQLAWRFRAAPEDLKTVALDRVESVWPVHGSVLVLDGVAYAAAGRSSYLDGGMWVFGLNPATGEVVASTQVQSGHPGTFDPEAVPGAAAIEPEKIDQNAVDAKTFLAADQSDAFAMGGATNDVLVSDGSSLFLRTLRFDRRCTLQESTGRHLFSTSGLLDDAEDHRSHWVLGTGDFSRMPVSYSWIADRPSGRGDTYLAVPYGLMLAFSHQTVWGVRRGDRYTLFAEANRPFSAAAEPLADFRPIGQQKPPFWQWSVELSMRPRAMLRAGDVLVLGGMPQPDDPGELGLSYEGRRGGELAVFSAADGSRLAELRLDSPPVWDGLAAAAGRVYTATSDGKVVCVGNKP